ncbi:sensor histidine kinase [Pseudarthrobacter albicanus]|uniref:sensor histidine kinase n=1 Tax=Pseudarthrobacter albicanus TaxID=2823873 RepID=UPI001BA49F61|nr:HAMP domain-containing sensor histidine kinase [Pseudarthrobacter albicanus]
MKALNRLSIRARITMGTLLLAALFFGSVALVVRQQVEGIMQNAAFEVLQSDATPFETAIRQEPNEPGDNPGEGQLVAVIDPAGTTQTSTLPAAITSNMALIDLASTGPQQLVAGDATYLVAVETVETGAGDWTIISARNQHESALVFTNLTTGLTLGLGALTLLFGAVSWRLTGAALRPVTQLRRSAEAIVASGTEELLPVGPAKDEINDLATTLNSLIDNLRASAARERQMVSDASHELRTPLAVLQAQLELLRTGDRSSIDSDIVAAERATLRLTELVESLLELSRLDAGRPPTPATVGALVDEAGEAIDRARLRAMSDDVKIDLIMPDHTDRAAPIAMPALVYGRVLDNLLSNALRAVDGKGQITATIRQDPSHLITVVTDNGPGIGPEFLRHAFDRFSQEGNVRGTANGSGLGLAIAAAAADSVNGTVTLENAANSGLIVRLTIPVTRERPDPLRENLEVGPNNVTAPALESSSLSRTRTGS